MQRPPKIVWNKVRRGKSIDFPEGIITEYHFPLSMKISFAIGQMSGKYPPKSKWARNKKVDEWYIILKGEAQVELEGSSPKKLKKGDQFYIPRGTWYKAHFKNAIFEIPTVPCWSPKQCEYK